MTTAKDTGFKDPTNTGDPTNQWISGHKLTSLDQSDASDQTLGHKQSVSKFNFDISDRNTVIKGITIKLTAAWSDSSIGI